MARDYFCCYHSYLKKTRKLSEQEVGRLFRALMEYSATGETQELKGREAMAFDFIADDIDRAKESYSRQCETNSENGAKGGRGNKAKKATALSESEKSHNEDEDEDENKDKDKSPPDGGGGARAREEEKPFVPPTVEEVRAFCRERRSSVKPERFVAYYNERNWKGVIDWQDRLISWEHNGLDAPALNNEPASYDIERAEQRARTSVPELRKKGV